MSLLEKARPELSSRVSERRTLEKQSTETLAQLTIEVERLQRELIAKNEELKKWAASQEKFEESINRLLMAPKPIVFTFDVGGRIFKFSAETLARWPDSWFGTFLSWWQRKEPEDQSLEPVFLDRDPMLFEQVISTLLRSPKPEETYRRIDKNAMVEEELRFFGFGSSLITAEIPPIWHVHYDFYEDEEYDPHSVPAQRVAVTLTSGMIYLSDCGDYFLLPNDNHIARDLQRFYHRNREMKTLYTLGDGEGQSGTFCFTGEIEPDRTRIDLTDPQGYHRELVDGRVRVTKLRFDSVYLYIPLVFRHGRIDDITSGTPTPIEESKAIWTCRELCRTMLKSHLVSKEEVTRWAAEGEEEIAQYRATLPKKEESKRVPTQLPFFRRPKPPTDEEEPMGGAVAESGRVVEEVDEVVSIRGDSDDSDVESERDESDVETERDESDVETERDESDDDSIISDDFD